MAVNDPPSPAACSDAWPGLVLNLPHGAGWGERSALGELLGVNFDTMPLMQPLSGLRICSCATATRSRKPCSAASGICFALPVTFTLYDLTNTYFEGTVAANPRAARGRSKEKRSDCPLVTLGLVLDGSGFVRRSKMFAGNVAENTTLADMLEGLTAPKGALVIMDAGIATAANIAWLKDQEYRHRGSAASVHASLIRTTPSIC